MLKPNFCMILCTKITFCGLKHKTMTKHTVKCAAMSIKSSNWENINGVRRCRGARLLFKSKSSNFQRWFHVQGIKTLNKFFEKKERPNVPPVFAKVVLHLCQFCFLLPSFLPRFSSLVVALESLHHEQLPEILRGKFLDILAVVVDLPCWRVATCIHTPPQQRAQHKCTHPQKYTYIQAGGREQISGEQSKHKDQNVVRRRRRAEQLETATKRAVWVGDWVNKL